MKITKDDPLKEIFVHWRNFLFVFIGMLLVIGIIGLVIAPLQ